MTEIRLWTVQDTSHWLKSVELGFLSGGTEGVQVEPEERTSYDWMKEQMRAIIPNFSGDFPVWAWTQFPKAYRSSSFGKKGSKRTLVEMVVPRERLLLSNYMVWSMCIYVNHDYIPYTDDEDEWRRYGGNLTEQDIRATWPRVFELEAMERWLEEDTVQACIDRVYMHEIVSVEHYTIEKSFEEELAESD